MSSMGKRDKGKLKTELIAALTAAVETARAAHRAATEGATHTEARQENDKDTRGLEQSYLARGQAQRVAEIEIGLAQVSAMTLRSFAAGDAVALGALVTLEEGDAERLVFVAPHGGGTVLSGDVRVVTPSSPFGSTLLGKHVDDAVNVPLQDRVRSLVIIDIA
jgi:transcription elongation GreA/GreB family factor